MSTQELPQPQPGAVLHERQVHDKELRAEAHRVLDDAKAGIETTAEVITRALRVTGDIEG